MVATGQLLGASDSESLATKLTGQPYVETSELKALHEQMINDSISIVSRPTGRSIDTFDSTTRVVPEQIPALVISYLPNSKLDRLRVTLAEFDAVCTPGLATVQAGSFTYTTQLAPLAPSPLKVATLGQILNANPFKQTHPISAKKWLTMCVNGAGITDLVLDQSNEQVDPSAPCSSSDPVLTDSQAAFKVDEATASQLLQASCLNKHNLEQARLYLPTPTDAQRAELAMLFGEIASRPVALNNGIADRVVVDQGWTICPLQ